MPKAADIIRDAASLPVEGRTAVVESLLQSLNPPDSAIDRQWLEVAQRRLRELRAGEVEAVPGAQVFAKVRERFGK